MMNWELLIDNVRAGDIIPVIGDGLILVNKSKDDKPIPLHQYIAEELTRRLGIPYTGQRISELDTAYPDENIMARTKAIYSQIDEKEYYMEPLEKLAAITDFNFYISTALDHRLEKALCKTRNLKSDQVETIDYSMKPGYQIPRETGDTPPVTVFNLLGNLRNINKSAFTEEETLEHFFSISDRQNRHPMADYLMKRVKSKIFLFIGLDFPDWLMRFIIRILTNQRYKSRNLNDYVVN